MKKIHFTQQFHYLHSSSSVVTIHISCLLKSKFSLSSSHTKDINIMIALAAALLLHSAVSSQQYYY